MMTILYGIKNCDSVKKARKWLEQNEIDYKFHDFRSDGLSEAQVSAWIDILGWEALVNKRSTTWKALDENVKNTMDTKKATAAILASPTLIKRPLLATKNLLNVGFKDSDYQALLTK
jgi:Spx/MgsR family transcriptional regulator